MKRRSLAEAAERLQEELLFEYDFMAGPGMVDRPEAAGDRNYNTLRGAPRNFAARTDKGGEWPYEDDGEMNYGVPSWEGGNWAWGRGDRPGTDVSGAPPTPRDQSTWEGGPDEVEESADWDEMQRHGDEKYRNVWRDTPDGKQWTQMNNEAMGQPLQVGAVAPMDGLQHNTGKDADPVEDEEGKPIVPKNTFQQTYTKDMSGPAGQWGGPETIPGQSRGWAEPPGEGEDENSVWKVPEERDPMKLREFFDPAPVPVREEDEPEQHEDGDERPEGVGERDGGDMGPETLQADFGEESPEHEDSFGDRLGGTSLFVLPNMGQDSEFVSTPDKMGAARGTFGMHMDGKEKGGELVDKRSAWDVLQSVICAMSSHENPEDPGEAI